MAFDTRLCVANRGQMRSGGKLDRPGWRLGQEPKKRKGSSSEKRSQERD